MDSHSASVEPSSAIFLPAVANVPPKLCYSPSSPRQEPTTPQKQIGGLLSNRPNSSVPELRILNKSHLDLESITPSNNSRSTSSRSGPEARLTDEVSRNGTTPTTPSPPNITKLRGKDTLSDLLERFEAQKSPTSVTKMRRAAAEEASRHQSRSTMSLHPAPVSDAHNRPRAANVIDLTQSPPHSMESTQIVERPAAFVATYQHYGNVGHAGRTSVSSDHTEKIDWSLTHNPSYASTASTTSKGQYLYDHEELGIKSPSVLQQVPMPTSTNENVERAPWTGHDFRPRLSIATSGSIDGLTGSDPSPGRARKAVRRAPILSTPKPPAATARKRIRQEIATVTKAKQNTFLFNNRAIFLPLLPPKNHITQIQPPTTPPSPFTEVQQPEGVDAVMKPYQVKGLSFLVHMHNNGMPSILGDEMGLGKTIQTLSLFQFLKEKAIASNQNANDEARPFLVICPLIVCENWVKEAKKFTPGLKVLRFHGPVAERDALKKEFMKHSSMTKPKLQLSKSFRHDQPYDLVITTYEAYNQEKSWFRSACVWRYVVLDEGHKIKNHKTAISKALQSLGAEYRLLLTGTPLQNDLMEMWSLLHWLLPDVFADSTRSLFGDSFNLNKGKVDRNVLDSCRTLLELIMLRRTKTSPGVNLGLPTKQTIRLFVPLTPLQKKWYTQLITRQSGDMIDVIEDIYRDVSSTSAATLHTELSAAEKSAPDQSPRDHSGNWRRLQNLVLQLRKVCTHPYLIDDATPGHNLVGSHICEASGKFMAIKILVEELVIKQQRKLIIFSGFAKVLDWVQDLMTLVSNEGQIFESIRMDGNTVRAKRNLYVHLFQEYDRYRVFLISTKSGGVGLNLTAATAAVFIDEDWNPQVDVQAEARCHRIGQTLPVTIYKLCSVGTVEEQMLGRIHKKLYLSAKITDTMKTAYDPASTANEAPSDSFWGNYAEVKNLLRRGTKTLTTADIDVHKMARWDHATLLENCKQNDEFGKDEEVIDEDEWLRDMERVQCAVFEGQRYARQKLDSETTFMPETSRSDRRKGKERTVMIDGFAVEKATLGNADWEAVATLAGKDPSLKDRKVTREQITHFDDCFHCEEDSGKRVACSSCPRIYHPGCLSPRDARRLRSIGIWTCSQHSCVVCQKVSANAGGMIFRCRNCPVGFCEDCLDWKNVQLLGDQLDEYRFVHFNSTGDAYYIRCPECAKPEFREALEQDAMRWKIAVEQKQQGLKFDLEDLADAEDMQETQLAAQPLRSVEDPQDTPTRIVKDKMAGVSLSSPSLDPPTPALTTRLTESLTPDGHGTPGSRTTAPLTTPSKRKGDSPKTAQSQKRAKKSSSALSLSGLLMK